MKAVTYKRLMNDDDHFVGFQRIVVEYLSAGGDRWQLEPIPYDSELSTKISQPPVTIINMQRPMKMK